MDYASGRTHFIKIAPDYFKSVINRSKKCEIRKNDRRYRVGDLVVLQEFNQKEQVYTGRTALVEITYITTYNQKRGMVVFSFTFLKACLNKENRLEKRIEQGILKLDQSIDDLMNQCPDDEKWLPDYM